MHQKLIKDELRCATLDRGTVELRGELRRGEKIYQLRSKAAIESQSIVNFGDFEEKWDRSPRFILFGAKVAELIHHTTCFIL